MKLHHRIADHVCRHHKKYVFGLGTAIGLGMFKIIAIIAVFFGITATMTNSNANNEDAEIYKALTIFNKMDDILHQRCPRTHQLGLSGHVAGFDEAEAAFHNAKNLNEKFRATKKLNEVIDRQDEFLHSKEGGISPEEDKIFHELESAFRQIK